MNNRQRAAKARRERMDPDTSLRIPRADGYRIVVPLRYLSRDERADYLRRATSQL